MLHDPYASMPWLGRYAPKTHAQLTPRFVDMAAAFRDAADRAPDCVALRYFGELLTYRDIDVASDRLASWSAAEGVGAGDRVAIVLQNVPSFFIAAIASWKLGAIPVPANPMYTQTELARIFSDCTPAVILCHDDHCESVHAALGDAGLAGARVLLVSPRDDAGGDADPDFPPQQTQSRGARLAHVLTQPVTVPSWSLPEADDIGLLLYTSGTTGQPKGAMLRHGSLAFNAQAMGEWCAVGSHDRILGIAPLFHITGFVSHMALAILARCELILHYRFDAGIVLDTIRRERPTFTVGAITAFNALLGIPDASAEDFTSFSNVFSGGAAIAPSLRDRIEDRLGLRIHNCYGMTETASPTHACPPHSVIPVDAGTGALSIGVPIMSTEAKVVDEQGLPVPVGTLGEIWMRGPQVMQGYWKNPDESRGALVDGWMRSGDVGFMDAEGWFYLVDRQKDMINASGFKVWPREVEDALLAFPAIREAAVVGAPDPYRGETVLAYVSMRPGMSASPDAILKHCRDRLAAYKCPRNLYVVDELPKTPTGKIQRSILRDAAASAARS